MSSKRVAIDCGRGKKQLSTHNQPLVGGHGFSGSAAGHHTDRVSQGQAASGSQPKRPFSAPASASWLLMMSRVVREELRKSEPSMRLEAKMHLEGGAWRCQGVGSSEQGAGQGAGSSEQGAASREQRAASSEKRAGRMEQGGWSSERRARIPYQRLNWLYSSTTVRGSPCEHGVPGMGLSLQPTVSMSASIHEPGVDHESSASVTWASTNVKTTPQLLALLQYSTNAELASCVTSWPSAANPRLVYT